ncbi:heme ABC transporter ATP-binding protein [Candidatus Bipolaricaulota bacterium]|nr:heme ABC transporter ATP-binding protein [Candidatus Bipolaricaulota bacterium]
MKVKVEGLGFSYNGKRVLEDLDLPVCEGEFLGVVGPNGSGKTTLLKNIGGVLEPDEGMVYLDEKEIHRIPIKEIATKVAALQQETTVGFDFTVREVVEMGRFPHLDRFERHSDGDLRAVERAIEVTDLEDFTDRYVNKLSGGEKQRVFLALALAQEPDLLLLDEPTASLDINYQIKIMETVRSLQSEGLTVIAAIHDLNLAAQYTDRVALLNNGKVEVIGKPRKVLTKENIARVFGVEVEVENSEVKGCIHVFPRTGSLNSGR